jgi:fucose permease
MAPFLIGTFQRIGLGWRAALWVGVFTWVVMAARFHNNAVPGSQSAVNPTEERGRALPRHFWSYWLVLFLVVSIEWSIVFWGADFLEKNAGLTRTSAATIMSVYFLATVVGRIAGSRLTRLVSVNRLLLLSIVMAIIGFAGFWLGAILFWTLAGLFVTGLGVANLFPLTLSIASSVVQPHQSDTASGRISLGAGLAILIAPQALGGVADVSSIQTAYGAVAVLLLVAFVVTALTNRALSPAA